MKEFLRTEPDIHTRCIINQVFDWPASARECVPRA